ncbi:uncharacterized protein LOC109848374 isoform X1 [Asparagus officinalis]|uniref:uncharacterized protein LOC109848374 isoform X1 n=2 Tax=Asparagus officinalis TaxID=4686 RepID=UPI00098E0860|nr:uncharacterized protein LOC109848374 isoform X1 [Asparagus officinalis]
MKWEILHIPGKQPSTLEQSTVDVLASTIEPKLANILVRKLNQIYPLEDIRHVKRVRRRSVEGNIELSVILCLSGGCDNHMEGLSEDLLHLINVYQLKPFKAKFFQVAKFAATSKEEWEEQCKLWPTSYHPPNNPDDIVGFSEEDSEMTFNFMKIAIKLTKFSCPVGKIVNAAVIVDPLSREIIATASDETCQRPSSIFSEPLATHSSPQSNTNGSIDCNGGSAQKLSPDQYSQSYTQVSCLYPWGWMAHRPDNENSTNYGWHPLRHAALVAIEKAAARDRHRFPSSASSKDAFLANDSLQDPSGSSPAKRQKTNNLEYEDIIVQSDHANGAPSESLRPYLCTGFDMYLVWEPCAMCAMGLVHQRIRRIFYAFPNPNTGALGSVYRLQGEKSLNHHYSVYRVLLPETVLHEVEH